ncbi:hypothetical protein V8C86DRAFT_271040 [Haematococcus lacustris]
MSNIVARNVLHLAAWAQVGVLLRYYVGKLLGEACGSPAGSNGWVPCITSPGLTRPGGALFIDLPANVLGCFLMGLLSPADLLAAVHQEPDLLAAHKAGLTLPLLPAGSPLQGVEPLALGLRTGLCGSLTTYASWMLQVVVMLVGRPVPITHPFPHYHDVVAALAALLLGCLASCAALTAGQHLVLLVWSWRQSAALTSAAAHPPPQPDGEGVQGDGTPAAAAAAAAAGDLRAPALHLMLQPVVSGAEAGMPGGAAARLSTRASPHPSHTHHSLHTAALAADAAALLLLLLLTGTALGYSIQLSRPVSGHSAATPGPKLLVLWLSLLLGPWGCLLRWRLGLRLNARLPCPAAAWFPAGTLAANQAACLLDYAMYVVMVRAGKGATALQLSAAEAAIKGFGGSLSTVSTWVVEVQKLGLAPGGGRGGQAAHDSASMQLGVTAAGCQLGLQGGSRWVGVARAGGYMWGSIALSVGVGLLVVGTSLWTH